MSGEEENNSQANNGTIDWLSYLYDVRSGKECEHLLLTKSTAEMPVN